MLNIGMLKFLTQSVTGVALLITVSVALPYSSQAQRQPRTATTQLNTNYTLGGGDRIRVNVFEVPEYTGEYQVPPGGAINLPLIGSVTVQGLTTEQASDEIARRYARYLKRPLISINLLSPRPINVIVAGEVSRPGAYALSLQGGAGNDPGVQYPTVLAAITTAQGTLSNADVTQVQLRRKLGRSGQEQVVTINLKELIRTGRLSQDITLRDGDTIVVPTAARFDLAEARNLAAANFAADPTRPRTVAVIGEVNRPGSYLVTQGSDGGGNTTGNTGNNAPSISGQPTVTRALQLAGGITPQADLRSVKIRRQTRTGGEQIIDINLWQLLQSGDVNQDTIVQDGDTIFLPTATELNAADATVLANTTLSAASIQVGVVGEVKRPGPVEIRPNSSLNQALLAAGGFNDARASSSAVDLVRLNPNGSVTKRKIKIDFAAGINSQTNPILRNNDVVVVYRSGSAKVGDTIGTVINPLAGLVGVLRSLIGF